MNRQEYLKAIKDVIYLTECAVNGRVPAESRVDAINPDGLYKAAEMHMLTAACAMALGSAGVKDNAFIQAKAKAIRKNAVMDHERETILARFEAEGIWYMPLKGSIIKELYPQYGMRQMSDNDILFDSTRAEDVRGIMEDLGFTTEYFGQGNHDVYHKPPVSNFEMHTELFGTAHEPQIYEYYKDIKPSLIKDEENGYGYHFSPEDFYIYITAHEYKHYSVSGTGLRSLVDTYVYLTEFKGKLDMEYIRAECEKLGIADFERQSRGLALHLFGREPLTDEDKEMLRYIVFSGTYGTVENSVNNKVAKYGTGRLAKIQYAMGRITVPIKESDPRYGVYSSFYTWFYEKKYRLPLLFFYRLFKALTESRGKALRELKILAGK